MFNWIYEVPPLLAIAVFGVTSVVVCWIGILISHRYITAWVHREPGLNPTLGDLLQYFGVIYGLNLVLHRDNDLSDRDRGSSISRASRGVA